jgi:hypothetical protein
MKTRVDLCCLQGCNFLPAANHVTCFVSCVWPSHRWRHFHPLPSHLEDTASLRLYRLLLWHFVEKSEIIKLLKLYSWPVMTYRPDDGGSKDPWNVGKLIPDNTALQPTRQPLSYSPPWEPQIPLDIFFCCPSFQTGYGANPAPIRWVDTVNFPRW